MKHLRNIISGAAAILEGLRSDRTYQVMSAKKMTGLSFQSDAQNLRNDIAVVGRDMSKASDYGRTHGYVR